MTSVTIYNYLNLGFRYSFGSQAQSTEQLIAAFSTLANFDFFELMQIWIGDLGCIIRAYARETETEARNSEVSVYTSLHQS